MQKCLPVTSSRKTEPVGSPVLGLLAGLPAAVLLLPVAANAQANSWEHSISVYGWFTGFDSRVETPLGSVETELSFGDVWEDVDIALFSTYTARRGPWAFTLDLNHSALASVEETPFGIAFEEAEIRSTLTVATAYASYTAYERADTRLELAGGLRGYWLDLDTRLEGAGAVPDQKFSSNDNWIDPVVGMRVRTEFGNGWFADAAADVGGFGLGESSELSWQAYAGLGYRLNDRWSLLGGYRHLSIETEIDGTAVDLDLSGLVLGATYSF